MKKTWLTAVAGFSGLLVCSGAFAADLPSRKSAPVAYVKICDVYGRGFYYIPGTNTCLKVGGRVRFELAWYQSKNAFLHTSTRGNSGFGPRFAAAANNDTLGWRSRAYINMDARTQTAWGTVQTMISVALRSRSGVFNTSGGFGAAGQTTASPQVYAAYIRFAGFTVGRAASNFYFMPSRTWFTGYWGASSNGRLQLAYTATFGGGFSATLALEDKDDYRGAVRFNRFINPLIGIAPPSVTTPNRMPAFVANLRLDQGWGTLQVMGAVIRNNAVYTNPVLGTLNTVSKTGWAVAAGLMLKLDALAKGDRVYFHAGYANGALDHILPNYLNGDRSDGRGMGGFMRDDHNVGLHVCTVTGLVCAENNKAWSMGMVFTHYWTPSVRSNFALSYASITPGSVSRAADWYAFGGLGKGNAWAASGNLIWSPTSGFDIGVELHYRRLRQSLAGTAPFITPYGNAFFSPETVGTRRGESTFYTKIRVQRTF